MPKSVQCKKCLNYRNEWCAKVLDSPDPYMVRDCRHFATLTNADRIRAMTDEELADFLDIDASGCVGRECGGGIEKDKCRECWMSWLKEEA